MQKLEFLSKLHQGSENTSQEVLIQCRDSDQEIESSSDEEPVADEGCLQDSNRKFVEGRFSFKTHHSPMSRGSIVSKSEQSSPLNFQGELSSGVDTTTTHKKRSTLNCSPIKKLSIGIPDDEGSVPNSEVHMKANFSYLQPVRPSSDVNIPTEDSEFNRQEVKRPTMKCSQSKQSIIFISSGGDSPVGHQIVSPTSHTSNDSFGVEAKSGVDYQKAEHRELLSPINKQAPATHEKTETALFLSRHMYTYSNNTLVNTPSTPGNWRSFHQSAARGEDYEASPIDTNLDIEELRESLKTRYPILKAIAEERKQKADQEGDEDPAKLGALNFYRVPIATRATQGKPQHWMNHNPVTTSKFSTMGQHVDVGKYQLLR